MKIIVQQALGKIHGGNTQLFLLALQRHNEFMRGTPSRKGHIETGCGQPRHQVVGVQCGVICHPVHTFTSKHACIDIGTH